MSNRRRRHDQEQITSALAVLTDACPDCDADLEVRAVEIGVTELIVRHDDTCPTYRQMKDNR